MRRKKLKTSNIVLTGGGTGGHLAIVNEMKKELNSRGIKPIFVGSANGQDKSWFENDPNFEACYFLQSRGVMNKGLIGKVMSLISIIILAFKMGAIFKKHNIGKVFSVGGYSAAPASFGAIIYFKNLFIHEQNAKMGVLNKVLSVFSKNIFSSYSINATDYPVGENYFNTARTRKDVKTIIFLGGSQGAKNINNFALQIARDLTSKGIKIIHQTGKNDFERVAQEYTKLQIQADVFAFHNELFLKMADSDLAISRAGASTTWELCANGLPCIFVPYPFAASNHQYFNAKFFSDKKLGFLVLDGELQNFKIDKILNENIQQISSKLQKLIKLGGAKTMASEMLK